MPLHVCDNASCLRRHLIDQLSLTCMWNFHAIRRATPPTMHPSLRRCQSRLPSPRCLLIQRQPLRLSLQLRLRQPVLQPLPRRVREGQLGGGGTLGYSSFCFASAAPLLPPHCTTAHIWRSQEGLQQAVAGSGPPTLQRIHPSLYFTPLLRRLTIPFLQRASCPARSLVAASWAWVSRSWRPRWTSPCLTRLPLLSRSQLPPRCRTPWPRLLLRPGLTQRRQLLQAPDSATTFSTRFVGGADRSGGGEALSA